MALPFMPFYWGDYWRDTAHLSDAEHVSYLRLISHYWQHGSLPTDDARLARIAGRDTVEWLQMRPVISAFFQIDWRHKRIERDLERQMTAHEARVKGGQMTAAKRWADSSATSSAYSNQNHNQNHNQILKPKLGIGKKTARGTRLPQDWSPRPEDGQDAEELAKFRDHFNAVAGQKGVKLDWDATWRNWLRNSERWKTHAPLAKPKSVSGHGDEHPINEPFPRSGTIRYSRYADFVRSLGTGLDPDWIADRFRTWAETRNIALDGPDVIRAFKGFARAQKAV